MKYKLKTFIAGNSGASARAVARIEQLCREVNDIENEFVDIFENPQAAIDSNVIATPMVVRVEPQPDVKVVGDVADLNRLLQMLRIEVPEQVLKSFEGKK